MEFVQTERPSAEVTCSMEGCLCRNERIPIYTGYLYVSRDFVDLHKEKAGRATEAPISEVPPMILCEQGAKLRQLDLAVAAADARYWWMTGLVPIRETPLATSPRS